MREIKELLQQGSLAQACMQLETQLKDDPLNSDKRAAYIELLCVQGELEKADNQLDMMVRQHPDFLIGAVNLRQLIRAMQARLDFNAGGMTASLFREVDDQMEALVKLRLALKEGALEEGEQIASSLESLRGSMPMQINGKPVSDVRDLDDTLGGYLELFGTDGKYYLTKFSDIEYLDVKKPESLVELVLRRVEVSIKDGPSGEAFLPTVYAESTTELERLGRESDWKELTPQLVTGVGQKMLLVGDQAITITEITSLGSLESTGSVQSEDQEVEAV